MSPIHYLLRGYANIYTVSGTACRSEFWWLFAANFGVFIVCVQLTAIVHHIYIIPAFFVGLVFLTLGNLTAAIRRLRDSGLSPFWVVAALFPLGPLLLAVLLMRPTLPEQAETHADAGLDPALATQDDQVTKRATA